MDDEEPVERITLEGLLDGRELEAFRLELRRLAARHGVDVVELRVEPGSAASA
jgi:hypothetical protein